MRRLLLLIAVLGFMLVPSVADAAWLPLVPCGGSTQEICTPCHIFEAFKNLIDLVLFGITGPIAAFIIVWAGGMMLLAGGDPSLYGRGKTLLTNTVIGVSIILVSWVATNFLIKSLIQTGEGSRWYEFSCPESLSRMTAIETSLPTGTPMALPTPRLVQVPTNANAYPTGAVAPIPYVPDNLGVQCPNMKIDLCGTDYKCQKCTPFLDDFSKYGADAGLLGSIMYAESSCGKNLVSPAGAYGPMQMLIPTAAKHAEACEIFVIDTDDADDDGNKTEPLMNTKTGKPVVQRIDAAFLMELGNIKQIICLAAMEVRALKGSCGPNARDIAAGYNAGPGWCKPSRDCATTPSCGGGMMRAWECPWDNRAHTLCNSGLNETKFYAPKVATCATK